MKEETLRKKIIRDLLTKRINGINLKSGTFDLLIEGNYPTILELKIITGGGKRGFVETEEGNMKGFTFTPDQTREILKMKFPIYVLAKDGNDYYLFEPKWVKKQVIDLKDYNRAIIYEFRWNEKKYGIVQPITYNHAINKIAKVVKSK